MTFPQGFQRPEQRRGSLADAGRRFDQGVGVVPHGGINRRSHVPLALPVVFKWKGEGIQRGSGTVLPVIDRGNPAQVGHGVGHQPLLQLPGVVILAEFPLFTVHAGVDQANLRLSKPPVQAEQCCIDLPLGPVGGIVVLQYVGRILRGGLDLQHLHDLAIDADPVSPAVNPQDVAVNGNVPGHSDLAFPAVRQQLLERLVAPHTLAHAGRGTTGRYKVALFKGEFRQRSHTDRMYFLHGSLPFP